MFPAGLFRRKRFLLKRGHLRHRVAPYMGTECRGRSKKEDMVNPGTGTQQGS